MFMNFCLFVTELSFLEHAAFNFLPKNDVHSNKMVMIYIFTFDHVINYKIIVLVFNEMVETVIDQTRIQTPDPRITFWSGVLLAEINVSGASMCGSRRGRWLHLLPSLEYSNLLIKIPIHQK